MQTFIGQKQQQSQAFLEDGTRIPVTSVYTPALPVISIKNREKAGYWALQLGFGTKKHPNSALSGHIRGAKLKAAPRFLREIRLSDQETQQMPTIGEFLKVSDVFKPGDMIDVVGISKGKGYAGVVKRHHFKGGPRTHGQSDRERAPGSIGQTTTPGRVYKGKRMAGRMGHEQVTVRNLEVFAVEDQAIVIKGLIPGGKNTLVMLTKVGEDKKFVPMYKEESKETEGKSSEAGAGSAREDKKDAS